MLVMFRAMAAATNLQNSHEALAEDQRCVVEPLLLGISYETITIDRDAFMHCAACSTEFSNSVIPAGGGVVNASQSITRKPSFEVANAGPPYKCETQGASFLA